MSWYAALYVSLFFARHLVVSLSSLTFLLQSLARNTNRGKSPYRGMNGVVLFYSSNDVDSFANLHLWLEDVRR